MQSNRKRTGVRSAVTPSTLAFESTVGLRCLSICHRHVWLRRSYLNVKWDGIYRFDNGSESAKSLRILILEWFAGVLRNRDELPSSSP